MKQEEVKVKYITIQIKDKTVQLTVEETNALYNQLANLLGKTSPYVPYVVGTGIGAGRYQGVKCSQTQFKDCPNTIQFGAPS